MVQKWVVTIAKKKRKRNDLFMTSTGRNPNLRTEKEAAEKKKQRGIEDSSPEAKNQTDCTLPLLLLSLSP